MSKKKLRIPKLPDVYAWVCACGRHLPSQVLVCGDCEERNPGRDQ